VRVIVLFNQPVLPRDHPEADSEQWVATTVEDISSLLRATGFRVSQLSIGRNLYSLKSRPAACHADVVFNLFEGLADRPETEIAVARLLEKLQVPFTGSPSRALRLALNKKSILRAEVPHADELKQGDLTDDRNRPRHVARQRIVLTTT